MSKPGFPIGHLPEATGVYRIMCVVTGEFYIGSSANIRNRAKAHLSYLRTGRAPRLMQDAWNKYGHASFRADVVELCKTETQARRTEKEYIRTYSPTFNTDGTADAKSRLVETAIVRGNWEGKRHGLIRVDLAARALGMIPSRLIPWLDRMKEALQKMYIAQPGATAVEMLRVFAEAQLELDAKHKRELAEARREAKAEAEGK